MELWTSAHMKTLLPALAVLIGVAALLRYLLGKKDLKIRMIPMQILACFLLVLEVGKQAVSFSRGYDLYHLPFHFCSIYLFVMPVMAFYRGKHRQAVARMTSALTMSLFLLILIYPNLIYSAYDIEHYFEDYLCFHTVTFHNIVMLMYLLFPALGLYDREEKTSPKGTLYFIMGFCVVSATMAQLLKTNYANFYTCNVPVFEALRVSLQGTLGYVLTQTLYVLILSLLNVLFVLMSFHLDAVVHRLTAPKKQERVA